MTKCQSKVIREVESGCPTCGIQWEGANAQPVAARHTDATGHQTWVNLSVKVVYGDAGVPQRETLPGF